MAYDQEKADLLNENAALKALNVILENENNVLKSRYETALKVLDQIAERKRKTQERNLANAVVTFLKHT